MLACGESNFSNFKFEYLCKNEFLRKTILICLSGAQMGSIHAKIEVENLVTLPLTVVIPFSASIMHLCFLFLFTGMSVV